jgi:alanine racemase
MAVFEAAARDLPGERSLANSAAILRHRAAASADWVRAGIMSYGSAPDFPQHDIVHWDLRPTMTLRSKLIATQRLAAGDSVGYGSSFVCETAMTIGIAACGYADGYPRHAATGTPVLVDSVRTRTLGRVSMDMIAVDLSPLPQARIGSEVTLWGEGPRGARLPIDEVARAAGTIGYELMCALAARVPVRMAAP